MAKRFVDKRICETLSSRNPILSMVGKYTKLMSTHYDVDAESISIFTYIAVAVAEVLVPSLTRVATAAD